ncbi:hypothetical protein HYT55_05145 [Candidatus Woesearchaeota archaeon]|nr:hypothetical protein [Candidatus Woesearchaeota archaeon]
MREHKEGNVPEKKFRAGSISATVWLNKGQVINGEESEYRTISIERNYMDKEGKWHSNNSLRINDLPKARLVLEKAYEFLLLQEQDLFKGGM